jgi:ABC-type branched-subunit amino acid transport system substrate-binding protein
MKRRIAGSLAVIGATSLVLAACGGSSDDSGSPTPTDTSTTQPAPTPDGECSNDQLIIGTLLPATGDLAYLGPPEFAGVDLAVEEIDAGGGVLGKPVINEFGDSGDTKTDLATQTVDSHISKGVQVIVGAAASGVSLNVLEKVTVQNGILMISPANTSPALTTAPDDGLYFRTAPSDALQGAIVAAEAIDMGFTAGATISRDDPYGNGLRDAFVKDFEAAGGTITSNLKYDPAAPSFEAEVAEIAAGNPEFVQVVGFDETTKLLQEMIKQGIGPQDLQIFLVDGNSSKTAYADFPAGTMDGVIATQPTGDPSSDVASFESRLLSVDPDLTDFTYGAQSYDATMLVAIAAQYAGCADARAIANALPEVANEAPGKEKCSSWDECNAIIQAGGTPDYDGVTGPLDFNEYGDPKAATIEIVEYTSNTDYEQIGLVTAEVPVP